MLALWKKSCDQPTQHIKKQRHYLANKGPSSQSYGFSSSHVLMWELDYKESWAPKNGCFWTVVLEKTLESPLDCREIQPIHPKGDQSSVFIGRIDAAAETTIVWRPDVKNWLIGNDPDVGKIEGRRRRQRMREDEMFGWHHQLDGHEFEQPPGVGDGQRSLVCCSPWGFRRVRYDWVTEMTDASNFLPSPIPKILITCPWSQWMLLKECRHFRDMLRKTQFTSKIGRPQFPHPSVPDQSKVP